MKTLETFLIFLFYSCILYSQEKVAFNDMLTMLDANEIKETKEALYSYDFDNLNEQKKASYLLTEGIIQFKENKLLEGYKTLLQVKKLKSHARKMVIYNANEYMIRIANTVSELSTAAPSLIQENCRIAQELNNPKLQIDCIYNTSYNEIIGEDYDLALKYNYQMQRIALDNNLQDELLDIENNIGTIHYFKGSYDSTLYYFNRNLERCRISKDTLAIAQRINNMAMLRAALQDYETALDNINEAEVMARSSADVQLQSMILRNKADILTGNENYQEAANYYYKHLEMNDTLAASQTALELKDIQTKYETAEQKLKNAELEAKNLRSKAGNYLLLFLLSIAIGIAAYFILNYKKSKKILEERKLAQEQRELKLMRDQELASIDAMIAGQEKERLKIASDLHDDLGSSLTAIKISLENAKERTSDLVSKDILNNAHTILSDTYVKVRRLSHTQNSRVLSENGWISSLKDLVQKINNSGKIDIEVVTSGLQGSLSNSTELNLFRIIQELINNIIKHAHATEASVIITGYDHMLDIIVEDNGKGLDVNVKKHNGTGLINIKKRVENMNGTFTIDSNPQKGGCSISIEIPLV